MPESGSCFNSFRMKFPTLLIAMLFLIPGALTRLPAQEKLNYRPELLFTELKKLSGTEVPGLDETGFTTPGPSPEAEGKFLTTQVGQTRYYVYSGRVNSCRAGGCSSDKLFTEDSPSEYFDYFIIFDSTATIQLVRVFNYAATHGQEIMHKKWLAKFIGYQGNTPLEVGKKIDAISGATISVYGITGDIVDKTRLLKKLLHNKGYTTLHGNTQGTRYTITYKNEHDLNLQAGIAEIFDLADQTFSTYIPTSLISCINDNTCLDTLNELFINTYLLAHHVSELTAGSFDITSRINTCFSYKDIQVINNKIIKSDTSIRLDFNAIAQGKTVDLVAEYIESENIHDYMIEIGGEIRCKGLNPDQKEWETGIELPYADSLLHPIPERLTFSISGWSVATSGNYQNPGHLLDPRTGKSIRNELLSVSIFAPTCAFADALATGCMVMGLEKLRVLLSENPQIRALIIYKDPEGKTAVIDTFSPQERKVF